MAGFQRGGKSAQYILRFGQKSAISDRHMTSNHPSAGDFWKKLGIQFTVLIVAFLLVLWVAAASYQWWRSHSAVKDAHTLFAQGNFRAAHGAAERALIDDPDLLEAAQIAAESLDKLNSPEAVEAWFRVGQIRHQTDDAVRWARSALAWKRDSVALGALHTIPEDKRANAPYQALLGDVLVSLERYNEAERAYIKAIELAPADATYRLRHSVLVAGHFDNPAKLAAAETDLHKLAKTADYSIPAYRALAMLKIRQKDWPAALAANSRLLSGPNVPIGDRVQQLEILRQLGAAEFLPALATAQKNAREATDAAAIFHWMNQNGMTAEALQWASTMEPRLARHPELARRLAESQLILKDWRNLRRQCDDLSTWGPMEHLRNAYAARALRQMDDIINSAHRWTAAAGIAGTSREATADLLRLADEWNWREELRDILWTAANRVDAPWALAKLVEIYTNERSADGLLRAYARKTELDPNDDTARNRMVHYSLLLDRAIENSVTQARGLAKRHAGDATYAATLALAELKAGNATAAAAAFTGVRPVNLESPEPAFYHSLALYAAGREKEAATAFAFAQKRPLLPEELRLLPPAFQLGTAK